MTGRTKERKKRGWRHDTAYGAVRFWARFVPQLQGGDGQNRAKKLTVCEEEEEEDNVDWEEEKRRRKEEISGWSEAKRINGSWSRSAVCSAA